MRFEEVVFGDTTVATSDSRELRSWGDRDVRSVVSFGAVLKTVESKVVVTEWKIESIVTAVRGSGIIVMSSFKIEGSKS